MQNTIPTLPDVATRIAQRTLASRGDEYAGEVRHILDKALTLMCELGTDRKPRVADIVSAAGVSNDAFYRFFASKDALVAALVEDGAHRLTNYLAHQMAKDDTAEGQIRRWVDGVLSQAEGDTATRTRAVLWNGSSIADGGREVTTEPLARLLIGPLRSLGSPAPELDASLISHAVVGRLSEHLWRRTQSSPAERRRIHRFCTGLGTTRADTKVNTA